MNRKVRLNSISKLIIASLLMLFMLPACGQDKVESKAYGILLSGLLSHSVPELVVEEVDQNKDVIYLDARERNEFEVSHIKHAVWIGYEDFDLARLNRISKEDTIIVYCSVGYRSEKIAEQLIANGYENVSNLYGGIFEWKNQDHDVVNENGMPTDSVHAFDKTWGRWLNEGVKVY